MRSRLLASLLFLAGVCGPAGADPAYRLRIAASAQGGALTVTPYASGPAGRLRYEVQASKQGPSGKAASSQAGQVALSGGRESALSTVSFELREGNRYVVAVRLFRGESLVAEETLRYPP